MSIKSTRKYWLATLFITSLLVLPGGAKASVIINEVMYNPEGADSGREWVELYNDGESEIAIVGGSGKGSWRIVDSSNHTITDPQGGVGRGTLTIPAGGYLVLMSDPSTVMSEYSGDYSVAKASVVLNNTGATVSLVDGDGKTVDSVTYAASQGASDNGNSLQLASGAWLQAKPTPGAANASEEYVPPVEESSTTSGSSSSRSKTFGYVEPPVPGIFADAGEDRTVIVGAATKFVATAYDRDRRIVNYAKFSWNFGDGTTAEGPEVMHHFSYPGRYLVDLVITNTDIQSRSHVIITAEPATVALTSLPNGGVSIQNKSGRDLDLSFWQVKAGESAFTLPERSVALKDAAINISATVLGFEASGAKLYYPDGAEVLMSKEMSGSGVLESATINMEEVQDVVSVSTLSTTQHEPLEYEIATTTDTISKLASTELAAAVAKSDATLPLWASLAGLTGLVGAGVASVWAVRNKEVTSDSGEEFTIE